jgi:hypothetical protein
MGQVSQVRSLARAMLLLSIYGFNSVLGQTCTLSVAGLNKDRFVWGLLFQECGWEEPGCWHSPPFGNWGVDSNYGQRQDTNQFEGWKPLSSQWQWNSCTAYYLPPNCDYYNWNNCTQQRDRYTANPHGTKGVSLATSCPQDTNGDGICDTGGCKEIFSYSEGTNWMAMYELDVAVPPWCGTDDHVETLYFPATAVYLSCTVGYYSGGGSPRYGPMWADLYRCTW